MLSRYQKFKTKPLYEKCQNKVWENKWYSLLRKLDYCYGFLYFFLAPNNKEEKKQYKKEMEQAKSDKEQ